MSLRKFIAEARVSCGRPNNCPAIVQALIPRIPEFGEEISEHLIVLGLNKEVREALKQYENGEKALSREQLDLWPQAVRSIVHAIDRARVFVPSRADFIELQPELISAVEMREAGRYLIAHGEDAIRRGNLLIRLADLSRPAA
jgi:hypothetical protein